MYTGTLIEQLMTSVERAEQRSSASYEREELERWYAAVSKQWQPLERELQGVA